MRNSDRMDVHEYPTTSAGGGIGLCPCSIYPSLEKVLKVGAGRTSLWSPGLCFKGVGSDCGSYSNPGSDEWVQRASGAAAYTAIGWVGFHSAAIPRLWLCPGDVMRNFTHYQYR